MARLTNKVSPHVIRQLPDFVISDHPVFADFLTSFFKFLESAEIQLTSLEATDGITQETETGNSFVLLLNGTRIQNDVTIKDVGDKVLLESSVYGKFESGETIVGQSSGASTVIIAENVPSLKLFVVHEDKLQKGEVIVGQTSGASAVLNAYKPNPVQTIQQLLNYRDPDRVIDTYLTKFRDEFLHTIPESLATGLNKRNLIKNIKSLYKIKGTAEGHQMFFRMLFNELSETIYPRDNMLRVSDGKWDTQKIMRCISTTGDTLKLVGRTITQNNVTDDANINESTAVVENVFKFQIGSVEVTEFILNNATIVGTFVAGQSVIGTQNDDDVVAIKATITGIPDVFSFTNDGSLYSSGDTVTLSDAGGDGAIVQVDEVGHGSITEVVIDAGGSDYEIGDTLVFSNTGTGGNSAQAKVSIVNGGFVPEDANSNSDNGYTDDHIILEDETQKGGIYTGNKFVQESGTGVGDITDIRFINNGFGYTLLPTITITTTNGEDASVVAFGSEIGRILTIKVPNHGVSYNESPSPPTVSFTQNLLLKGISATAFTVGETITGNDSSSTVTTALVDTFDPTLKLLKVKSSTGTFEEISIITGNTSGATATIAKNDRATGSVTINTTTTTSGSFINEDGHVSENTMRIQDSLYYQDFSYVIKVGRSITEWRDSFKRTMHTAGFYYAGEVNTTTRLNAQISSPVEGVVSGISESPIMSVFDFVFSPLVGRRLGTADDGTSLRATPTVVGAGSERSTFLTNSTRDVTLTKEMTVSMLMKEKTTIRSNTTVYGRPVSSTLKGLNARLLDLHTANRIQIRDIASIRLSGLQNQSIDGQLVGTGEFINNAKTNFTIPAEVWQRSGNSFDEDGTTFDNNSIKFDKG